jgi:hypothetical protein
MKFELFYLWVWSNNSCPCFSFFFNICFKNIEFIFLFIQKLKKNLKLFLLEMDTY